MTTTDRTYNGWTNYETWAVNLWIDNEESTQRDWAIRAQECYDEARDTPSANARLTGREPFTHEERAVLTLERCLKEQMEEDAPDLGASLWADLLSAAMQEVDWHEIAANMIERVDRRSDEEEADEE